MEDWVKSQICVLLKLQQKRRDNRRNITHAIDPDLAHIMIPRKLKRFQKMLQGLTWFQLENDPIDESDSFRMGWSTNIISHQRIRKSPIPSGIKFNFSEDITQLDAWMLLFDERIIRHIVKCTNLYAKKKYDDFQASFEPIDKKDLFRYFAIYFCLCLLKFPQERFPWFEDIDNALSELPILYSNSFISSIMGRNRWMDIHQALNCTSEKVKSYQIFTDRWRMQKLETTVTSFHQNCKRTFTRTTLQVNTSV